MQHMHLLAINMVVSYVLVACALRCVAASDGCKQQGTVEHPAQHADA